MSVKSVPQYREDTNQVCAGADFEIEEQLAA